MSVSQQTTLMSYQRPTASNLMKGILEILKRVTPITPNPGKVQEAVNTLETNLDGRTLNNIPDSELENYKAIVRQALGERANPGGNPINPRWKE